MADNIKISELVELTSGSLGDATIFPVVDGGTTKKASLSSLQSYLTDDLATDSELATQIGNVNSTIAGLSTTDISEGTNEYYTNIKVDARITNAGAFTNSSDVDLTATTNYISGIKTRLNTENVISSSQQISASAASSGFGQGGGTADYTLLTNRPSDIVSSSTQTISNLGGSTILSGSLASTDISDFSTAVSSSAASAGFGAGGGGGSSDYISNITLSNSTLTFTGVGSAFNNSINLAAGESDGGNLLTTGDAGNFVAIGDYELDSASFAAGGGGGSVPAGTVSSSAQTLEHISTIGVFSSSNQVQLSAANFSGFDTDAITEGTINKFATVGSVTSIINTLGVNSGSGGGGAGANAGTVSSSIQIENLGFPTNATFGQATSSLQSQIDGIDSGVNLNDVNIYLAKQRYAVGMDVTGSILLRDGSFSGSGAQLSNIPASAVVGLSSTTQLIDGDNNITVDNITGITSTIGTGNFNVNLTEGTNLIVSGGYAIMASGSWFSGSGAGLTNIPASSIDGGVDGQKINSGSFSASIEDGTGNFLVGPPAIFDSTISASGGITAESISVGTSGTPTLYSSTNLNLSASNAVVITDSPMRLNPFAAADTASFTLAEGDMVFSSDDNDFFGYRIVNQTGSWYSLTAGTVTSVEWDTIVGAPGGLVSSSEQIVGVGNTLLSSSAQFLPSGAAAGTVYFEDTLNEMTGAADFTYTAGTKTLNVNKVIANELVYNTSLTGAGNDTGSYGRVETDALSINSAIEFPTSDGTPNQVLKTDGNGNLDFGAFADVLGNDNITTSGTVTMGTGSVTNNMNVQGTFNIGNPVHSTFNNQTTTIEANSVSLLSSGSMLFSSSMNVTISDVLTLPERTTLPSNPPSGSLMVSSSGGASIKPWFWDGLQWTALY
jgi:hypothetical protein